MDKQNIGMLLIATGKYDRFVMPLVESARTHAFNNHNLTFFVFTDSNSLPEADDIVIIPHEHREWPYPTLLRYRTFYEGREHLKDMDYLYYSDADMLFVDEVGDEAIGDRVATIHPGFLGGKGTPERNPVSTAYLAEDANNTYFAGGFNGGKREVYLEMSKFIDEQIKIDESRNYIAIWHDESHMNRYLYHNPPTRILDSGYCYGESMNIPYRKRLLALDKDHQQMRRL